MKCISILIGSLLTPLWMNAQTLKPGLYQDLKPDKPIVLDTGSYTFNNQEMLPPKSPEGELWKGYTLDEKSGKLRFEI